MDISLFYHNGVCRVCSSTPLPGATSTHHDGCPVPLVERLRHVVRWQTDDEDGSGYGDTLEGAIRETAREIVDRGLDSERYKAEATLSVTVGNVGQSLRGVVWALVKDRDREIEEKRAMPPMPEFPPITLAKEPTEELFRDVMSRMTELPGEVSSMWLRYIPFIRTLAPHKREELWALTCERGKHLGVTRDWLVRVILEDANRIKGIREMFGY